MFNFRDFYNQIPAHALNTAGPTQPVSGAQGTGYRSKIYRYGEASRQFMKSVDVVEDIINSADQTYQAFRQTARLTLDGTPPDQTGTTAHVRTITRMDTVFGSVNIALSRASDFGMYQISVDKWDKITSRIDLVKAAKNFLGQTIRDFADLKIRAALQATSVTNRVYGGNATAVTDTAAGDVMNVDMITNAQTKLLTNGFLPLFCFLHPRQTQSLKKSTQFRDASMLGSDRVNINGFIGDFAGTHIIETFNVQSYAATATDLNEAAAWAVAGDCGVMVGVLPDFDMGSVPDSGMPATEREKFQRVAAAWVWKVKPEISYEYVAKEGLHNWYLDIGGKAQIVQPDAVCLLKTSQA